MLMNKFALSASGVLLTLASTVDLTVAMNQTAFVNEAAQAALPLLEEAIDICANGELDETVDPNGICMALEQVGGSRRRLRPPRGGKKCGKYSKSSKSTKCPNKEKFKVFVATTFSEDVFLDRPSSRALEHGGYNPTGRSSAIAGFVGGIVVTFDKEVDPLTDFSGYGFDDFLDRLEDAAQYMEAMVGVITGTCTSLPNFYGRNEYCNYGLDWLTFPLTEDKAIACDPPVKFSQLRAAGTLTVGGDKGLTPVTGTGFDLSGAVGGNVLFVGDRYWEGSATLLGYVPFTKAAACNANEQFEAVTLQFIEEYSEPY